MNTNIIGKLKNTTEDALIELVNSMPNPAHIKDAKTNKYIVSNKNNLDTYNFQKTEEILGLSVIDLDYFMRKNWGPNFAKEVIALDEKTKEKGKLIISENRIFKDIKGFLRFQDMYKSPIFSRKGQVTAILTLVFDYTKKIDLLQLYEKYRELYDTKTLALKHFSSYIKINDLFYESLTEKELVCLLHARLNQAHKNIAMKMDLSIKTVETHISNITNKLKQGTIQDLIVFLRNNK
jgi:DNA-binding CsgD family transcriptional regulator